MERRRHPEVYSTYVRVLTEEEMSEQRSMENNEPIRSSLFVLAISILLSATFVVAYLADTYL